MRRISMFDEKWLRPYSIETLETFIKIPRRAQELLFNYLITMPSEGAGHFLYVASIPDIEAVKSPIEYIYYLANEIYSYEYTIDTEYICTPQYEINVNNKNYFADFHYGINNEGDICTERLLNVLVECDGHDFHQKSKKQVKHDNERQLALQTAGYDVIRFSGTQIYENPFLCVKNVHEYIESKIKRMAL